jgi:hypothetical protein
MILDGMTKEQIFNFWIRAWSINKKERDLPDVFDPYFTDLYKDTKVWLANNKLTPQRPFFIIVGPPAAFRRSHVEKVVYTDFLDGTTKGVDLFAMDNWKHLEDQVLICVPALNDFFVKNHIYGTRKIMNWFYTHPELKPPEIYLLFPNWKELGKIIHANSEFVTSYMRKETFCTPYSVREKEKHCVNKNPKSFVRDYISVTLTIKNDVRQKLLQQSRLSRASSAELDTIRSPKNSTESSSISDEIKYLSIDD